MDNAGASVENTQSAAESGSKDEYLRLCGAIAPLMPGKMMVEKGWVRPVFAYALMNALNGILKHPHEEVKWVFENGLLIPSTSWTLVDLKQRITTARKWTGSEAQLLTAIENLVVTGFLSVDPDTKKYSVTPKLLDWLLGHASHIHQAVFNDPPPESWTKGEKGSWLELNEIAFRYLYDQIGDHWRDFRNAVNKEIASRSPKSKAKKLDRDYTTDYIGERPEYWVVMFTVGFLEPISQWSVPDRAKSLKISIYADNLQDVANAVEQLRDFGVVTIDDAEDVRIAPKFLPRMKDVISAVNQYMPRLRADCHVWKAKQEIA